ncbi:arrestin domain-containing protein 3-like isoform X2 [Amphiprion ocellaris]|uniref:arrestin domain-containing protein 3-like isoform X2 n=1 Tax=Amphiprion ocellaris TaxID=80972 RepID=UPI0024118EA0|nr:arrestin domain-containing protein 3-like isoform X2 [Amphiprion ocellaris]
MSSNVKSFLVGFNPINESNTFTSGDMITGQTTLELSQECKIDSLCIKLKGKAEVQWTESYGKTVVTYHKKEKYFSVKHFIIQEGQGNNTIGQGFHVYPFSFQIPTQELPSSFHGKFGKILYTLEANLSRSMRIDSKAKAEFTLIHKGNPDPMLMISQQGNTDKKMKLFNSGTVGMDVNIERMGFHQGEGIKVVASIQNRSSREIRPKYCLYRKYSYFAKGKRKVDTKDILKEQGEAIPPSAGLTVTKIITVPPTTPASILNCSIIKVYLDVKYASDPEIKFPIVILPALEGPQEVHSLANPAYGFDAFPNSSMPGRTSLLQNPTASGPFAPSPISVSGMYLSSTDFDRKL